MICNWSVLVAVGGGIIEKSSFPGRRILVLLPAESDLPTPDNNCGLSPW